MKQPEQPTTGERRLLYLFVAAGAVMILFAAYGIGAVAWNLSGGSPLAVLIPAVLAVAVAAWVLALFRRARRHQEPRRDP
ncbi:MAG TPA: hypothetical protein VNT60_01215 [Deinococcales bacterium]|nr:hypothetical protein [Deinococcales bacterium]